MGESFARYKPQAIVQPKGLIKVELCSASGLLATAKCEELIDDPATGEKVARRTTYFEIATDAQAPTEGCPVHGDAPTHLTQAGPGGKPGAAGPGNWPKPTLAVDLKAVTPVEMKAPTIIGKDPFNSDASVANAMAMKDLGGPGQVAPIANDGQVPAEAQGPVVEVRKAVEPGPLERSSKVESPIKLPPPPALDF